MENKLTIKEPTVITVAHAPPAGDSKFRNTNMQSTFISNMSPRGSDFNASMSNLGKPSPRARRSTKHGNAVANKQYEEASKLNEEVKIKDEEEDENLPFDELTGMQMYENELKLTAMQKLQLRIA